MRATAEQLLALRATDVAVVQADGTIRRCAQEQVAGGDHILVATGERIGVDGVLEHGSATLDTSLVTGESLPVRVDPGAAVYAGTLNLGTTLTIRATATGGATLLAECVRLIEAAETRRGRFVVLADRVARRYAPAVHLCALLTFLWWFFVIGVPVEQALLTASAVLIITCPCALALAVPAVQVIATGRLFRGGMLLKSATALERLAEVDTVVFDKTGTLTEPLLAMAGDPDPADLQAGGNAGAVKPPSARALACRRGGRGRAHRWCRGTSWPGPESCNTGGRDPAGQPRLLRRCRRARRWARDVARPPWCRTVRFCFDERPRADAAATIARLRAMGLASETGLRRPARTGGAYRGSSRRRGLASRLHAG